jgi:hypothetical protein
MSERKPYRVLDVRKPFGGYAPGTLVELTNEEAQGALDKLELATESATESAETAEPVGESRREKKRAE